MEADPVEENSRGPDAEWEAQIRSLLVRSAKVPDEETQRARMKEILRTLDTEPPELDKYRREEARDWLDNISSRVPDYNQFVASSFADHLPAWQELLGDSKRKSAKMVLGWLRRGFKPKLVGTKLAKPQKQVIVENMLRRVVSKEQVGIMLEGKLPHKVEFANHRSFYTNWGFSKGEIEKLVVWGAASIWDDSEGEPEVISPLGVADSAGKQRLIINEKYVNLFLEDLPFQYERLRDILAFTEEGSCMATWDLKSGYFHVPIHPKFRKYFAFKVGGFTFTFNVLCFGFAQACYVFTKVMQEPAFELRKRGIPLSDYVDDTFTAARTLFRCLRQSVLGGQLFAALGAFFGLPECQFEPIQLLRWLGFMVDTREQAFKLGGSKVEKLKQAMRDAMAEREMTPRKLAVMAGRIIAASPAVLPAALYSRALFEAMQGRVCWDEIFPSPKSVHKTASFWLNNIDRFNGRRWWPRATSVGLRVDASRVGYGGWVELDGEKSVAFCGIFTDLQAEASSTEREVTGNVAGLAVAAQQFPAELADNSVLILGDN
jgi:hypothetical protein